MKARIFSTFTLWIVTMVVLYFGRAWGGLALLIVLGAAAQWEFYGMLEKLGAAPRKVFGLIAGAAIPALAFMKGAGYIETEASQAASSTAAATGDFWARLTGSVEIVPPQVGAFRDDMMVFVAVGLAVASIFYLQLAKHKALVDPIRRIPTMFGVLGFPFMLAMYAWPAGIHWVRNGDLTGVYWVVWSIAATKFTDVGALLAGKAFGKNKLWPAVSPGKTWEGCVGGVITSALVAAGLAALFGKLGWGLDLSPAKAALLALPLAILSVPSDLVESVFKRLCGLKDSGKTIPGIGGAYDLVDSLLLTAPVSLILYLVVTA